MIYAVIPSEKATNRFTNWGTGQDALDGLIPNPAAHWLNRDNEERVLASFVRDATAVVALALLAAVLCEWRRRRRHTFFQYTLQELFLAMTASACLLAWWQANHQSRLAEDKIVSHMLKTPGATYWRAYDGPTLLTKPPFDSAFARWSTFFVADLDLPWNQTWLDDLFDDFSVVVQCAYEEPPLDPKLLRDAKTLQLRRENFERFLSDIKRLPYLEGIEIGGVDRLADADWEIVFAHKQLKWLNVSGCHVNDAQFPKLSSLQSLVAFRLANNPISTKGVRTLLPMNRLAYLDLDDTAINGEIISTLAAFPHLRELSLDNTNIQDRDVERFTALQQLAYLRVRGTKLTRRGLDRLGEILPNCSIRSD